MLVCVIVSWGGSEVRGWGCRIGETSIIHLNHPSPITHHPFSPITHHPSLTTHHPHPPPLTSHLSPLTSHLSPPTTHHPPLTPFHLSPITHHPSPSHPSPITSTSQPLNLESNLLLRQSRRFFFKFEFEFELVKGKREEWRRGEGWRCGKEVGVDVDVDWVGGGDGAMGRCGDGAMWRCDGLSKRKSAKDHK